MSEKLLLAIRKRLRDETLVPSDTLKNFLTINGVKESSKMSRRDLEYHVGEAMSLVDFSNYLPQQIPLTESLMKDLLDPLTTVRVPTNMYRVTMRKLLRLTLSQLQEQAKLMKLDALDLDEEGIASLFPLYNSRNSR